ncbi:MAG: hypothetical protein WCW01_05035 [Gammaproteobacteria bacterium]
MQNRPKGKEEQKKQNEAVEMTVIASIAQAKAAASQQQLQNQQTARAGKLDAMAVAAAAHAESEEHGEDEHQEVAPRTTVQTTTTQTSAAPAGTTAAPSMPSLLAMGAPVPLSGGAQYTVGQGVIHLRLTDPPSLESLQDFAAKMKEAGYTLNIDDAVKQLNEQSKGKKIDAAGQQLTWGEALSYALTEAKVPLAHSEAHLQKASAAEPAPVAGKPAVLPQSAPKPAAGSAAPPSTPATVSAPKPSVPPASAKTSPTPKQKVTAAPSSQISSSGAKPTPAASIPPPKLATPAVSLGQQNSKQFVASYSFLLDSHAMELKRIALGPSNGADTQIKSNYLQELQALGQQYGIPRGSAENPLSGLAAPPIPPPTKGGKSVPSFYNEGFEWLKSQINKLTAKMESDILNNRSPVVIEADKELLKSFVDKLSDYQGAKYNNLKSYQGATIDNILKEGVSRNYRKEAIAILHEISKPAAQNEETARNLKALGEKIASSTGVVAPISPPSQSWATQSKGTSATATIAPSQEPPTQNTPKKG